MLASKKSKRSQKLSVWCTATEKRYIAIRAREARLSASEYMREMALSEYLKMPRTLPPEVLAFNGQISHLAGILQPLSRKRLDGDELNALERATIQHHIRESQQLIQQIKQLLL